MQDLNKSGELIGEAEKPLKQERLWGVIHVHSNSSLKHVMLTGIKMYQKTSGDQTNAQHQSVKPLMASLSFG